MQVCAVNFISYSVTLHVLVAFHTHHKEYINCIYSLRYMPYTYNGAATFLQSRRDWTRPRMRKVATQLYKTLQLNTIQETAFYTATGFNS